MATSPTTSDVSPVAPPESGLFLRKATGLVRELSVWDAFNINLTNANAFANVAVLLPLGLALFAGANLWLSILTGLVGGVFVVLVYSMLAQVMPRSGGDYVFISRSLHPVLGFLGSWTMLALCAFFSGFGAWSVGAWMLPDLFAPLGTLTGAHFLQTWAADVAKPGWTVALTVVTLGLIVWFMARGTKVAARTQWLPVIFTVLAVIVGLPLLLFTSRHSYITHFDAFAKHFGTSAAQLEAVARKGGANLSPHFSFKDTIAFWPFVLVIYGYAINSIQIGGEVRNARRSQYISTLGATLLAGGVLTLFVGLAMSRIPTELMRALGYFQYTNPAQNPLPFPIYGHVPIALGGTSFISSVVLIVLSGAVIFGIIGSIIGLYFWGTRYMLAWSLDRVAPPQVAHLSSKRNVPVVALALMTLGALTFGVLLTYDTALTYVAGGLLQALLIFLAMVAGVLMPFRMRRLYKSARLPEAGGLPLVSILGAIGAIFMGVTVYFYASDARFGTVTGSALWFSIVTVASGVLYYAIAWIVARSRGVNLGLTYRELPPE